MSKSTRKSKRAVAGLKPNMDPIEYRKTVHQHLARTLGGRRDLTQIAFNETHPQD